MIHRIRQCVESYLREAEGGDTAHRYFVLDDSKGPTQGCFVLVFEPGADTPLLVAKGAPKNHALMREGRSVYEIEFENLRALERIGMNLERPTTPRPLRMWSDGGFIVTAQSALHGRLMKNVPGRELFSADRVASTSEKVLAWWWRFQERYGVDRRRITEPLYRSEILEPVERFRGRFVTDPDEHRFLERRFETDRRLLGAELPFMATHGDFCTANVMDNAGELGVFDWEFPLRHRLPLFDVFHFFSSTRFPFDGVRGESSHFDSFKAVFWGENRFNEVVRSAFLKVREEFRIDEKWLPDLFVLSLIHIANLKFDGLIEVHGIDEGSSPERLTSLWQTHGGPDKDVPFACIRDGVCENLRFVVRNGFPRLASRGVIPAFWPIGIEKVPRAGELS